MKSEDFDGGINSFLIVFWILCNHPLLSNFLKCKRIKVNIQRKKKLKICLSFTKEKKKNLSTQHQELFSLRMFRKWSCYEYSRICPIATKSESYFPFLFTSYHCKVQTMEIKSNHPFSPPSSKQKSNLFLH